MTSELALFLLSDSGRAVLTEASALADARIDTLTALTRLRKSITPEQATAVWELADLRRRAVAKFGNKASEMYFTREALEQSSGARAAKYHAQRFVQADQNTLVDLCGGIGGDALAFASSDQRVTLYELDETRALFAQENAKVWELSERIDVRQEDVTGAQFAADAAWFDPARRVDRRRKVDPEDYLPPLSFLSVLENQGITNIGVKLSPAIDHSVARDAHASLEFISDGGECKEALLWRGVFQNDPDLIHATVLTDHGVHKLTGMSDASSVTAGSLNAGYLYEPDPAVIRAHLVGTLAEQLSASLVDPQIAYLLGDQLTATPFATAYPILDQFPYSRRALQDRLNALDAGRVIVKKRGFPQEPDAVRKQLKLKGSREITVILSRSGNGHHVFLSSGAVQESLL